MVAQRLSPLSLALLSASCVAAAGSNPAAPAPASVAIPPAPLEAPARAADEPAPDPSAPLQLPAAALPPAPWVEPPLGTQEHALAERDLLGHHREIALGQRVAIFAAQAGGPGAAGGGGPGAFAVHEELGVVGPLKLPARFAWVGVAGLQHEALYAATPDGALHRAARIQDALRPDGFAPRGSVPGATAWDAAGDLIAAATGERVSVSADEGRSFTSAVVAPGKAVRAVLVRPDGVLVAVVEGPAGGRRPAPTDTFLSRDRGQTWKRSPFQPRTIERAGSWIWNGDSSCPAVLSRNGWDWTRAAPAGQLYDRATFGAALSLSLAIRAQAAGSFRSAVAPAAPDPPARGAGAAGREPPCKDDDAPGAGRIGSIMGGYGISCDGALCLLGSVSSWSSPTRTWIAAFGDGICDPARVPPGGACAAHLARPPTFAVVDRLAGAVTPVAAPQGCAQPVALRNAAGVGVLTCKGGSGGVAIFVRGAQGPWHAEGSQAIPAEAIERLVAAPDGTLVLLGPTPRAGGAPGGQPREPLLALVRSPLPLGAAQAWRRVAVPDGVAVEPAAGGAALLASSPAASAGRRLDVALDRPGQPVLALARDVAVRDDVTAMEARDGRVRFRLLPQPAPEVPGGRGFALPAPREARWHVLTHGGELALEAPPADTPADGPVFGPAGR